MLQIICRAIPYSSSTPHLHFTPIYCLISLLFFSSPTLSFPLSVCLSHFPLLINSRMVRLQASLEEQNISTSEYWKPATGAAGYIKSFCYECTQLHCGIGLLEDAFHSICVCLSLCHHLNAGEINIDPGQPLKLAPKTVLIQHTPLGSNCFYYHPFLFLSL